MPRVIVIERKVTVIERVTMDCYEDMTEDEAIQHEKNLDPAEKIEAIVEALSVSSESTSMTLTEKITAEDE